MQDDDRPALVVEPAHDAVDKLSIGGRVGRIRQDRPADIDDLHLDRPSSPTAGEVELALTVRR